MLIPMGTSLFPVGIAGNPWESLGMDIEIWVFNTIISFPGIPRELVGESKDLSMVSDGIPDISSSVM